MAEVTTDRRVRPRNRRTQIALAAGRAFSERGYHAVGMDDIAASVGITAAALYRHFPNKYALFVHCTNQLADGLVETLQELPDDSDLDAVLHALARTTVTNRESGGVYRWEARYLEPRDREALRATFERVTTRVAGAVMAERSAHGIGSDPSEVRLATAGALGAIGSATAHHTTVGARRMESLLACAARRTALTSLGDGPAAGEGSPADPPSTSPAPRGRREQILRAAVPLFHRDGYAEVSMAEIAGAVGLTPSGLYRHYAGKAEILAAACREAAEVLQSSADRELSGASTPVESVRALATAYVGYSFEYTALTSVALAEVGGLPPQTQRPLRALQRGHIGLWERHLRRALPEIDPTDARVLVHAGFGVVTEAGRALHWLDTPDNRGGVVTLVLASLGVDSSVPAQAY